MRLNTFTMNGQWCVLFFLLLTCVDEVISKRQYKDGDVKLVGGIKRYMGTVLVRYNNRWGSICDDGWDMNDAHTVCNQLGYYAAASAPRGSKFGIGRKRMFLYSLGCTGKESSVQECPRAAFSRFWRRRCPGELRTAGVICYPARRKKHRRNQKPRRMRMRPSTAAHTSATTASTSTTAAPTSSTATTTSTTAATTSTTTSSNIITKVDLEMVGGRYDNEGYIRVRVNNGKWTTVCSDHWTIRETMAACNQIGDIGQAKQAVTVNFYGGETESRDIYRIKCVGNEKNLSACNLTRANDEHVCSKKRAVAGIVCSKQLPDLVPDLRAIEQTMRLQDQPLYYLRCSMEENCLSNSAYVLRNTSRYWRTQYRRLMRFSTIVRNDGTADFRPFQQRALWKWHSCHMHYHSMEVFAHYDIMDANGIRLAEGSKASFCLEDTRCDNGVNPTYNCRGYGEQG
ncbi:hypothetical protein EGW08_007669, partial [Elysia chlorotica]